MCGIAGILRTKPGAPPEEPGLRRMLGAIRHRGPDQFGIYLDTQVGLGSARLSIIDLDSGQQPISNEDGTLWIVFNGEIFNYVELRADLERRGHRFATKTDTEVIVHAYEEFGTDCLSRFNGQWAFAIWDCRRRALFLARDRLGVRPLFYTETGGTLVFGSEIKSILAEGTVRAEIDPVGLDQIFTTWATQSGRSIFKGIVELPPGHFLVAQNGVPSVHAWWEPAFPEAESFAGGRAAAHASELAEELRALLVSATRIRLRADVRVGAYLSGGLDSSIIAAIARHENAGGLRTFSIAFTDQQFDESAFQRRMAEHLGTRHEVVEAAHAEIGAVFPEVVWHAETALMRTAPAPMFLLSKLVRHHGIKVVLTGEGADEFLGGYDLFKEDRVRRFWATQPESKWRHFLFKRLYPDIAGLAATHPAFLAEFFKEGLENPALPHFSHLIRWRNTRRTTRFFSDDVARVAQSAGAEFASTLRLPNGFTKWEPLARAQFLEITTFLSQYLLSSQGDRMAMAHSVEGRYPFLDVRVIEFCNRLPGRLKLRGLKEKWLLRRAAEKWLPDEIALRPKHPYRAPIHRCFFGSKQPAYARELLMEDAIRQSGLFKPSAVTQLVARLDQRKPLSETDDMALAGILSAQLVHHQFVARFRPPPALDAHDDVKVCRGADGGL